MAKFIPLNVTRGPGIDGILAPTGAVPRVFNSEWITNVEPLTSGSTFRYADPSAAYPQQWDVTASATVITTAANA